MYRQITINDIQFIRRGESANMKTFKGNMHDYIFESKMYANKIIENRKNITQSFIDAFNENIQTVYVTGAGTSNFSPQSSRVFMQKVMKVPTYVVLPTEIINDEYMIDDSCMVVGISATGTSANTINALEYAKQHGAVAVALTNDFESPFAQKNEYKVFIDHGVEDCSPKSKSYICELVTLCLCALEQALQSQKISEKEYDEYISNLKRTVDNLEYIAKESDSWYTQHSNELKACERMLVVGCGANKGNIQEGALKILECGRFQTSFYELEEFMHGIYHSIKDDCYLLYIANKGNTFERMIRLRNYLSEFTEHQFVISNAESGYHDEKSLDIKFVEDKDFYFIEYIVPMQIIAYRIAVDKGINPNIPSDPLFHQKMNSKFI